MHDEDSLTRPDSFGTAGGCERDLAGNLIDDAVCGESRSERDVGRMWSRDLTREKTRVGGAIGEAPEPMPDTLSQPALGEVLSARLAELVETRNAAAASRVVTVGAPTSRSLAKTDAELTDTPRSSEPRAFR